MLGEWVRWFFFKMTKNCWPSPPPPPLQSSKNSHAPLSRLVYTVISNEYNSSPCYSFQQGDALFWYNLKKSGEGDLDTLHAGCPVLLGDKWGELNAKHGREWLLDSPESRVVYKWAFCIKGSVWLPWARRGGQHWCHPPSVFEDLALLKVHKHGS